MDKWWLFFHSSFLLITIQEKIILCLELELLGNVWESMGCPVYVGGFLIFKGLNYDNINYLLHIHKLRIQFIQDCAHSNFAQLLNKLENDSEIFHLIDWKNIVGCKSLR